MAIYMNVDSIPGDSAAKGYQNWFDLDSFSWGVAQSTSTATVLGPAAAGKVHSNDFQITKTVSKGSPTLMLACCMGKHIKQVVIEETKTSAAGGTAYLRIILTEVLISSYSISGDAGSAPTDEINISFDKIEYDQMVQSPSGQTTEEVATYNFRTNSSR